MVRVEMEENPIMTIEINNIKTKKMKQIKSKIFCNAIPIILFMLKFFVLIYPFLIQIIVWINYPYKNLDQKIWKNKKWKFTSENILIGS